MSKRTFHYQNTRRPSNNHSTKPRQQGKIISIRESFGFITCAFPYNSNSSDLFFHFSNMQDKHVVPQIGDEVDFILGVGERDRDAAMDVRIMDQENERIEWEVPITEQVYSDLYDSVEGEDGDRIVRWTGFVEKALKVSKNSFFSRDDSSSNSNVAPGLIRVLSASDKEGMNLVQEKEQVIVRFHDLPKGSVYGSSKINQVMKGDFVEFSLAFEKRTEQLIAKDLLLVQTEKQRIDIEKENHLMETATLERGVVINLSNEDGYIKSTARKESVHFLLKHVELPEEENEIVLNVGQEVEFLSVSDEKDVLRIERRGSTRRNDRSQRKARNIKFLPKGSVEFYKKILKDVEGMVKILPRPGSDYNSEIVGLVQLKQPLTVANEIGENTIIKEVTLSCSEIPGGVKESNSREKNSSGMWIKKGDILAFDVEYDVVDKSYRAVGLENESLGKRVQLVKPCLLDRSFGVIRGLKKLEGGSGYGFIRSVDYEHDVYFRFDELLPHELLYDLSKYGFHNILLCDKDQDQIQSISSSEARTPDGEHVWRMGSFVSFDLTSTQHVGKQKYAAQRISLVPQGEDDLLHKLIATNARATIKKVNKNRSTAVLDFDKDVQSMSYDQRYPFVANILDTFREYSSCIIFPRTKSYQANQAVVAMANTRKLTAKFEDADDDIKNSSFVRVDFQDRLTDNDQKDGNEKAHDMSEHESKATVKNVKTLVVENRSLGKGNAGHTFQSGDIIECDVVQCRQSGKMNVSRVSVIQKQTTENESTKENDSSSELSDGVGIVCEVIKGKKFGFIYQYNENDETREKIFFHYKDVIVDEKNVHESRNTKNRNRSKSFDKILHKGDEVKFSIVMKNGKKNAVQVSRIPSGTVKVPTSEIDSNPCQGYILMAPSYTILSTLTGQPTKAASSLSTHPSSGRWENNQHSSLKNKESYSTENGRILLTFDPASLYASNTKKKVGTSNIEQPSENKSLQTEKISVSGISVLNEENSNAGKDQNIENSSNQNTPAIPSPEASAVGLHILYTQSSLPNNTLHDRREKPERGDLVSFSKGKKFHAKHIRLLKKASAPVIRGCLKEINYDESVGVFLSRDNMQRFQINLSEVISCDKAALCEDEEVEGILLNNSIYGICRIRDLYLESKLKNTAERRRLNLSIKQEGNGKPNYEQAKGPDGTHGFATGWTLRKSEFTKHEVNEHPSEETCMNSVVENVLKNIIDDS